MVKKYSFKYDFGEATVTFIVNTEIYTTEQAQETLNFFIWDYDADLDLIDEVMRKYAMKAIVLATSNNYNKQGVIEHFNYLEGFNRIDGSSGIMLTDIEEYEFNDNSLDVVIEEL